MSSKDGDLFEQLPVGTLLRARQKAAAEAWVHKYRKTGLPAWRALRRNELVVMLGCFGELPGYKLMHGERLVKLLTHDGVEVLSYWKVTNIEAWFEVV
jgi:hypothetical protein